MLQEQRRPALRKEEVQTAEALDEALPRIVKEATRIRRDDARVTQRLPPAGLPIGTLTHRGRIHLR